MKAGKEQMFVSIRGRLAGIIQLLFLLCIGFVLGKVLFGNTKYSYNKWIVLCTIVVILLISAGFEWILAKFGSWMEKHLTWITAGFLILSGIVMYVIGRKLEFQPVYDLGNVYQGAVNWTEKGSLLECKDYLYGFPHNLGLIVVFRLLFGIVSLFGCKNYFLVASLAGEACLLVMMWSVIQCCRILFSDRTALRSILLMLCLPPLYVLPDIFYTDVMSVWAVPLVLYLYLRAERSDSLVKKYFWYLGMGLAAAIGMKIKFTVVIILIAIYVMALLRGKWKESAGALAVVLMICALIYGLFHVAVYPSLLDEETAEQKNKPYIHWIMMGLQGNGSYNGNDYAFTESFTDAEERDKAIKEEIRRRVKENGIAGMMELYEAKTVNCFGDGTIGAGDFLDDNPLHETKLHDYVLDSGEKHMVYASICQGAFLIILMGMLAAAVKGFFLERGIHYKKIIPSLAFIGIWMFLMLWETSSRYFFNFISVMLMLAAVGMPCILKGLTVIKKMVWDRNFAETKE